MNKIAFFLFIETALVLDKFAKGSTEDVKYTLNEFASVSKSYSKEFDRDILNSLHNDHASPNPHHISREICTYLSGNYSIGCCKPPSKIFYNVILKRGIFFSLADDNIKYNKTIDEELPAVSTTTRGRISKLKMYVVQLPTDQAPKRSECKYMVDGTLHIMDRAVVHNMFHACKIDKHISLYIYIYIYSY